MTNVFDNIRESSLFKKFMVEELLFVEFKCLVEELRFGMWSDANYFVFVTNGRKMWKTYKAEYTVMAGDALFVKKGANIAHQFHSEDYCALMIFIPDDYIKDFMVRYSQLTIDQAKSPELDNDGVIRLDVDLFLQSYIRSLEGYFSMGQDPNSEAIKLKFDELLMNIFTAPQHAPVASYFHSLKSESNIQLRQVMMENFPYNLKLEDYATLCHMSLSTFKRGFKGQFNEAPGKWLMDRKIELATSFLQTTDKPVAQVALDCGFEDSSHFIKVFKKHKGETPQYFRNTSTVTST